MGRRLIFRYYPANQLSSYFLSRVITSRSYYLGIISALAVPFAIFCCQCCESSSTKRQWMTHTMMRLTISHLNGDIND
ncbi:hypothetical protein VTN31DRAFT_4439 [Thermomyces dupontii]|uniref:uncharacterized protein n=1 Tax=Talaromyces thermophilus TaxID=28565 RepID=UPI003743C304